MRKITLIIFLLIFVIGCININVEKSGEEGGLSKEQKDISTKTEIKVREQGLEMLIFPAQNNIVKDIITLKVTKVPSGTGIIGFVIQGPGIEDLKKVGPNLGLDEDGSDGWSIDFGTYSYPNNEYTIYALAFPASPGGGTPPIAAVQAKIIIQNEDISPVPSPAVTAPYKVIPGSCQNPLQSIEDAKKLNANTIAVHGAFAGYMDNNGTAVWEPPEKAASGCAKLIALAHENSLKTVFGVSLANKEDIVIEDFHFNREKFIQTYKEMLKSYAAFAQKNKVSIFTVAEEIDTLANIPTLSSEEKGKLTYDTSKEFIAGVREVYDGKIAVGLAGIEPDEPEAPYYPFEGADIICFSANEQSEEKIEANLKNIKMSGVMMKKIGQKVGIKEVILCEVSLYPKGVGILFGAMPTNAALKALNEKQSSFAQASFQENEKEFYRRLISEVGPEISGLAVNFGPPNPFSLRGRLAENTVAEEFEKWK